MSDDRTASLSREASGRGESSFLLRAPVWAESIDEVTRPLVRCFEIDQERAGMSDAFDLFEVMYTNRAHREFKSDPVPDELIEKVLDAAVRAPSGSNSQKWRFIVITDPEMRAKVGGEYRESFYNRPLPNSPVGPSRGPSHLPDTIGTEPPVLILACMENEPGAEPAKRTTGASIYPAVQNLMLAARAFGLGTVLTTIHQHREQEVKAHLGIPEHVDTYALIPMGYPVKTFGPLSRKAPGEVSFRDRWGQPL